jgi:tRNA threonylcarbamoyladenosine modification (KEOPS) complex  Pcc1 subunit
MITPEEKLKFQIKSVLHLHGIDLNSTLDEIAEDIYQALFNELNTASIRWVLVEMEEGE